MPLTLKDIAKKAGVAESTVSRAINNKPGVSEEKKQEIMKIVEKYDYQPNQLAQGLAKKETHILALLLSDLENPSYTQIIKSVENVANNNGYQIILCNTENKKTKEEKYLQLIERNLVDGAIIVGGELTDKTILNIALNKKAPLVLVNRLSEELMIPSILIDNRLGGYLATEHLLKQGLNKIALIMGSEDDYQQSELFQGYRKALKKANLKIDEKLIIKTDFTHQKGYEAFLQLMDLQEPPQGFFVTTSLLASGLVEAIKLGGYFIPGDFSVICYGDNIISSIIKPSLTVVSQPLAELGTLAARYLLKLIKEESLSDIIKVLKPVIKVRDSSIPQFKNKK